MTRHLIAVTLLSAMAAVAIGFPGERDESARATATGNPPAAIGDVTGLVRAIGEGPERPDLKAWDNWGRWAGDEFISYASVAALAASPDWSPTSSKPIPLAPDRAVELATAMVRNKLPHPNSWHPQRLYLKWRGDAGRWLYRIDYWVMSGSLRVVDVPIYVLLDGTVIEPIVRKYEP